MRYAVAAIVLVLLILMLLPAIRTQGKKLNKYIRNQEGGADGKNPAKLNLINKRKKRKPAKENQHG